MSIRIRKSIYPINCILELQSADWRMGTFWEIYVNLVNKSKDFFLDITKAIFHNMVDLKSFPKYKIKEKSDSD